MKECLKCQHCYNDEANFCSHDNSPLVTSIYGDVIVSGRYMLEKRLGKGGMGIVFRAKHKFLKSRHAIKVILPSLVHEDENLLVRFKQEAVLAASINHPNVIRVTDFGVEEGNMPFLVMEYVDGLPLSTYIGGEKRLTLEKTYLFFQPVALGVAEAHQKGIIHRDLKPQNIMVEKNLPLHKAVKVLDFGLAKIKSVESFGSLVQANTMSVLGSPPYMSPEQWEGDEVDARTDIYSLGVILYQMLTGQLPFDGDSIPAVMYQHLTAPPPTFESLGITLAPEIEAVVQRALNKKQDERYSSVEEMLNDFENSLGGSTISINAGAFVPPASRDNAFGSRENALGSKNITEEKTGNLSESQKQRILTYFDANSQPAGVLADEQLAQDFLEAQDRAEQAKKKASQAEQLVKELADAQKVAEEAQRKALEARQKIEADVRRRVEAEMLGKLEEQQALQKAEAERLTQEAEARKHAEDRANYMAQAALEAQKIAEAERKKAELEAHQRELEESVRRKAEINALQLAKQVEEEKRKYELARRQAEFEAKERHETELKRQKIESELQAAAEKEAERRVRIEAESRKQIEEQASRFEKEAIAAQERIEDARKLAEIEAQKREEAELARKNAEEEAKRLAQEIIEVQKQMEEIKMHTSSSPTRDETLNLLDYHSTGGTSIPHQASGKNTAELKDTTVPIVKTGNYKSATGQPGMEASMITVESQASSSNPSISLYDSQKAARKFPVPLLAGGGAAAVIFLLIGGFLIYSFVKPPVVPEETSNQNSANTPPPEKVPPKTEFIFIKGGSFLMGRDNVGREDRFYGDQYPAHIEDVGDLYVGKTEVTNAEYAEFVKATNYPAPTTWDDNSKIPQGQENFPVTNVSLADANAYAEWFTKQNQDAYNICRLPTEPEWEYVARNGSQATDFPWGNEWKPEFANLKDAKLAEVGKYPEATQAGIKDMLGNVSEWTSMKYALYKGNDMETPAAEKEGRMVTRGSSWITQSTLLKKPELIITFRYRTSAEEKAAYLGFRLFCVK